jgi:hypothetical protein
LPFTGKCEKRRRKRETCERNGGRGNKEKNAEEKGVVIGKSAENMGKKKKKFTMDGVICSLFSNLLG